MTSPQLSRSESAALHFHLWIGALNRVLHSAIDARQSQNRPLEKLQSSANGLSAAQASAIAKGLDRQNREGPKSIAKFALNRAEERAQSEIIAKAEVPTPLQTLRRHAGLGEIEVQMLVAIAACELDPGYERLFGFLVDDMTRSHASIEAMLRITDGSDDPRPARRRILGPGGRLRRLGLVQTVDPLSDSLKTQLVLAPGLFEWLLGERIQPPISLRDAALIRSNHSLARPELRQRDWRTASRLMARHANAAVGLWGLAATHPDDAVAHLAASAGLDVYSCSVSLDTVDWEVQLRLSAERAIGAGAALWIDCRNLLRETIAGHQAGRLLADLPGRIILTGDTPWRPNELLCARPYADIGDGDGEAIPPTWPALPGEIEDNGAALETAKHRLGFRQRRAAMAVARSEVSAMRNGSTPPLSAALQNAARTVSIPLPGPSARLIEPRRTLDDLILPEALHRQVAEIASFHNAADLVDRQWGFGRISGSSGAMKVLVTGAPGTGKSLMAECIAGLAGTALLKVDLSQVVSKWIGETEKNLEAVFDHAERSGATLFFDEADALFGKRGEVRHGTDRFANMEVSFLLQRLETFSRGLVILASNLRDEIDPAFSRRFQISLHFPKPERPERIRLWQLALADAPVSLAVDPEELATLELTGGAIVGAARMAALLAASDGCEQIEEHHIVSAIERQYRKEARLMAGDTRISGLKVAQARH